MAGKALNSKMAGGSRGNSIGGKSNSYAGIGKKGGTSTKLRGKVGVGQTMKASGAANKGPKVPVKAHGGRTG